MKRILIIAGLVLVAIAILAFVRPPQPNAGNQTTPGVVELTDLGVTVVLPQGLEGLAIATTTVEGLGTVLHVAVPTASSDAGGACELGVFYNVPKAALGGPNARWSEESLKAATLGAEGIPPQAKEFPAFYFVFEPSQTACATDASQLEIEIALRQALWMAVSTAELLPASETQVSIEDYVRTHISELSPEEAVLGGTFYVTAIEASNGTGVVSYEDGHIAFTADFTYETATDGMPAVTSFVIRP
ncbi:MAG TPA: hypothetical protein VFY28_01035 [Candidatus Paceibacterota bacterium]|nr:hypothetical protein [Candidatus Paceibacterota bacterium]